MRQAACASVSPARACATSKRVPPISTLFSAGAEENVRIAQTLAAQREAMYRAIVRIYGAHGLPDAYGVHACWIFDELLLAFSADPMEFHARGTSAGLETARWLRDLGDRLREIAPALSRARVDVFLIDLPERLEPALRTAARRAVGRFLGGFIAGIASGDTEWDYEHAGLTVRRLGTARSVAELFRVAVASTASLLHADIAWLAERRDGRWTMLDNVGLSVPAGVACVEDAEIDGLEALLSGEPITYADFSAVSPALQRLAARGGVATARVVPLMIEGVCEAMLGIARRTPQPFSPREDALAGIVSSQVSARLRELRAQQRGREALEALRASERLVREQLRRKERAVDVLQRTYIPRALPAVPGLRFDALYLPADDEARVGGDWYDVFRLDDRIVFSVGDVSGHGLDAAVTMGLIRQAIFTAALNASSPADVLVTINRSLLAQELSVATAIVGVIDPDTGIVAYACAGHPPPLVRDASGVRALPFGSIPLGIEPVATFPIEVVRLRDDDVLVLYTDALIEYARDVVAGDARLTGALAGLDARADDPGNFAAMLAERVLGGGSPEDDLAILSMRLLSREQSRGISSIQTHSDTIAWDFHTVDARSIAVVRANFSRFIAPLVIPADGVLAAEVVLGELLANAVEHAPGPVHVEVGWDGATPTLTVRDHGRGGVRAAELPGDILAEHGRGMFLIDTLSNRVDVRRCPDGGTEVVAHLALARNDGSAE